MSKIIQNLVTGTKLGGELNAQDPANGGTILHRAVSSKNVDLVKFLLDTPPMDATITDNNGDAAYALADTFAMKRLFVKSYAKRRDSMVNE